MIGQVTVCKRWLTVLADTNKSLEGTRRICVCQARQMEDDMQSLAHLQRSLPETLDPKRWKDWGRMVLHHIACEELPEAWEQGDHAHLWI